MGALTPWRPQTRRGFPRRNARENRAVDIVDKATRSRMMAAVRAKNSKIELAFRRRLFAMGFRYRLHRRDLPGTPDIVLPRHEAIVLVHGCFWHHHGCHLSQLPATRTAWWRKKLQRNRERDIQVAAELTKEGWRVLTIWECSFRKSGVDRERKLDELSQKARDFILSTRKRQQIPARPVRMNESVQSRGPTR